MILDFLQNGVLNFTALELVIYALVTTHITIAAVTIFLHRYQAHRSLELHPAVSHFFRLWLWLNTGMVTKYWAAIHRKHHAKCETEQDPHSPQTRGIWAVLLRGVELYKEEAKNPETITRYGHGTPDDWMEKNVYTKYSSYGIFIWMIIDLIAFGALGLTVWAVQMLWIPVMAAGVINGLAHFWGYRNFSVADASKNLIPWGIVIGGEELHNNHHTFPTSAKLSNKWYEFDIGWLYIRILQLLGLAKPKKAAEAPRYSNSGAVEVQAGTVDALISNRYYVMARFIKLIKREWHNESSNHPVGPHIARDIKRFFSFHDHTQSDEVRLVLNASTKLQTLNDMRLELSQIWTENANKDQLVVQFKNWCERAENSGISTLKEFSIRLRQLQPQ